MNVSPLVKLMVVMSLVCAACSPLSPSPSPTLISPSDTPVSPTPVPSATLTRTPTLQPSRTPTLTRTPSPIPTFTPTPFSISAIADVPAYHMKMVIPLYTKIYYGAKKDYQKPISITSATEIIFVPYNPNVFSLQSILGFPASYQLPTQASSQLYLLFRLSRKTPLTRQSPGSIPGPWQITQEYSVNVDASLYIYDDGNYYFLEGYSKDAGAGLSSVSQMVKAAVQPFQKLGSRSVEIQTKLERIIGYACGLASDPTIDPYKEAVLLATTLAGSDSSHNQRNAAGLLASAPNLPANITPMLKVGMANSDQEVGYLAGKALLRVLPPEGGKDVIVQSLQDKSNFTRRSAVDVLADTQSISPQEVQMISDLLNKDPDWSVRKSAALALGKFAQPVSIPGLVTALADKESVIRRLSAEALGKINHPDAAAALIKALGHSDKDVRASAAEGLGVQKRVEAVPGLIKLLSDPDAAVRAQAAKALGLIGSSDALPALTKAMEDKSTEVKDTAKKAIDQINRK